MRMHDTLSRCIPHLSRATISIIGLVLFHFLSGDSLASWLMLGLALLAFIARFNGLQKRGVTRIELSIVASACLLVYVQGGFIEHFNQFTWPLGISVLLLFSGLNAINLSAPQLRIAVTPLLLLLFFVSQRYFYPHLEHQFKNPLLAIGLMVAAWELLSALIHSNSKTPSWTETLSSLALALVYFSQTSNFLVAACMASLILLASFVGFRQSKEDQYPSFTQSPWIEAKGVSASAYRIAPFYGSLVLLVLTLFVTFGWILADRFSGIPPLSSLKEPVKPLEIAQRSRMGQPFVAFNPAGPKPTESLQPLNLNILEEALRSTVESRSIPNRRNFIIRKSTDTSYAGFNVEKDVQNPIQTTRISRIPGLRITAPSASQTLPGYTLTTEVSSENPTQEANSIKYDFGFGNEPSDPQEIIGTQEKPIELEPAGDPIRLSDASPATSAVSPRGGSRENNSRPQNVHSSAPRNIQASVGYSPELEYASNVSVDLRTNPVMEVYLPGSAKWMNELYLRFNTLDDIQNDRFIQADQSIDTIHTIDQPGWNPAPGIFQSQSTRSDPWTIALAYDWNSPLPVLGSFRSIRIPEDASLQARENSFTMRRTAGTSPFAYHISGLQISDTVPTTGDTLTPQKIEHLTALPLSRGEIAYLKRLATRIGGSRSDSEAFARRVGSYFEKNHPYSFDFEFKQSDEHLLISWLKARSPGICGYYAGAFTLLARARGIPTRVVVGALTREFDPQSRKFVVRDRDAHAWAEYLNEENHWVRADLTPISLESPRFASGNSRSDTFTANIETALERLDSASDPLEGTATLTTPGDASLASTETGAESDSLSGEAVEPFPRTLDLIDKVLSREAESTNEILQSTALLASEPDLSPEAEPLPPPNTRTQIQATPATPAILPVPAVPAAPAPIETASVPSSASQVFDTAIVRENSGSIAFYRILLNHWFVLLLLGIGISQFMRNRKLTTLAQSATHGVVSRDRCLAGRLLREIDAFCKRCPDPEDELHELRHRALQLRYSPVCSPDEVKALKRAFRDKF